MVRMSLLKQGTVYRSNLRDWPSFGERRRIDDMIVATMGIVGTKRNPKPCPSGYEGSMNDRNPQEVSSVLPAECEEETQRLSSAVDETVSVGTDTVCQVDGPSDERAAGGGAGQRPAQASGALSSWFAWFFGHTGFDSVRGAYESVIVRPVAGDGSDSVDAPDGEVGTDIPGGQEAGELAGPIDDACAQSAQASGALSSWFAWLFGHTGFDSVRGAYESVIVRPSGGAGAGLPGASGAGMSKEDMRVSGEPSGSLGDAGQQPASGPTSVPGTTSGAFHAWVQWFFGHTGFDSVRGAYESVIVRPSGAGGPRRASVPGTMGTMVPGTMAGEVRSESDARATDGSSGASDGAERQLRLSRDEERERLYRSGYGAHSIRPAHSARPLDDRAWYEKVRDFLGGVRSPWLLVALMGAVFFFEFVLKMSTTGQFFPSLLYILPFSICTGGILYLLCTLPIGKAGRTVVTGVLLGALGFLFALMYFVHHAYKIFYDLNTILGGAGGVASGFGEQAVRLVFSPSGLLHLIIFLTPFLLVLVVVLLGKAEIPNEEAHGRLLVLGESVVALLLALLLVSVPGTSRNTYWKRYEFGTNVGNYGLVNSLCREVGHQVLGSSGGFNSATGLNDSHAKGSYPDSALDIDFDALAASTDDEALASLDAYVSALDPSAQNQMTGAFKGKNLIFISAEAFTAEAIREDKTPTLYRMANKGIQFTDYYQPASAGTTGGETSNILGVIPMEGGRSLKMTSEYNNYLTIGNALNRMGYEGWAFHNNTFTFYDRDQTHNNLGYNHGYMGYGNGMEEYVTDQWPQSDLEMMMGTFENIYGDQVPFNVYYMSVSGHNDYSVDDNAMTKKNWDAVADLDYSDAVKGYIAANIELDKAMEYLIGKLEERGIADDTVIVISADHFPYGLDDENSSFGKMPNLCELYGYEVEDYFQRDHNRLIMWSGALEEGEPIVVDSPTSSLDILPTLLNLFGCEWDSRLLPGRDVFSDAPSLVFFINHDWKTDLGTFDASTDTFTPKEGAEIPEGYVEKVNDIVSNKLQYCQGIIDNDYFRHVFGDPGDVNEVNERGKQENAELIEEARQAVTPAP